MIVSAHVLNACTVCGGGPGGFIAAHRDHAPWCAGVREFLDPPRVYDADMVAHSGEFMARAHRARLLCEKGHTLDTIAAWMQVSPRMVSRYLRAER